MPGNDSDNNREIRQERRERKLRKKQERIPKHGKSLAQIYRDAITRRMKEK